MLTIRPWLIGTIMTLSITLAGCSSEPAGGGDATGGGSGGGALPGSGGVATGSGGTGVTGGSANAGGSGGSTPVGGSGGGPAGGSGGSTPAGGSGGSTPAGGSGGSTPAGGSGGSTPVGGSGGTGVGGSAGGGDAGTGGTMGGSPVFHVFLLLGQSNMEGWPKAQAADRTPDERVRVLGYDDCSSTGRKKDEWAVATPPLHSCWNDGLGPGDYFGKTIVQAIADGDSIGLVPCAVNGEKIETFMKNGGSRYQWIIDRARLAQQAGGVIQGILFHQGESNCGDPAWPGKVNTLVQDLRSDLGLGDVPFLAGELPYNGNCANHNTLVGQLPSVVSNAHVVSATGLSTDPADVEWNLHFDRASQVTLGTRYGEKMIEVLGW